MAEEIEKSMANYQKQREQHLRLREKVLKKKVDIEIESKNRYETKK